MAGFRIKYDINRIWVRIQPLRKTRIRIQYFYQIGSGSSVFKIFTKQLLEIIMHTFVPRIQIWVLNPVPDPYPDPLVIVRSKRLSIYTEICASSLHCRHNQRSPKEQNYHKMRILRKWFWRLRMWAKLTLLLCWFALSQWCKRSLNTTPESRGHEQLDIQEWTEQR